MKARRMALRVRAAFFSLIRDDVRVFRHRWPVVRGRGRGCGDVPLVTGLTGKWRECWLSDWQSVSCTVRAEVSSIRTSGMCLSSSSSSVILEMCICGWLCVGSELAILTLSLFFHQAVVRWVMVGQMVLVVLLCWIGSVCCLTSSTLLESLDL